MEYWGVWRRDELECLSITLTSTCGSQRAEQGMPLVWWSIIRCDLIRRGGTRLLLSHGVSYTKSMEGKVSEGGFTVLWGRRCSAGPPRTGNLSCYDSWRASLPPHQVWEAVVGARWVIFAFWKQRPSGARTLLTPDVKVHVSVAKKGPRIIKALHSSRGRKMPTQS